MKNYKQESDAVQKLISIKGDDFLNYRKVWNEVNNFKLETDFPLFLHIEPSYKCNFRCPMCVQGIPELKRKFGYAEQITTEQIRKILVEGQKYNCPSISFQGDNEPFLIKEMPDWFDLARKFGFQDIMVNTNGSIMTESLAERIIKSGLTRIRFSLDAITQETYDKIRTGGIFQQVMDNINLFIAKRMQLKSSLPVIGVNFVKMKANQHEIEEFIDYWNSRVDFIVIQDFMVPDTQGDYSNMIVANNDEDSIFFCNQPWQRLYIRGNGEVTPCCAMFNSLLKIGDIKKDSLYSLWHSAKMKKLRKILAQGKFENNPICLKCSKSGLV